MTSAGPRSEVWTGLAVLVTAAWVGVALHGAAPSPVATDPGGAAAAAATAALLGAGWRPTDLEGFQLGGVAIGALPVAVAAAAGGSTALLTGALAIAAVATAAAVASGAHRSVPRHAPARSRPDTAALALGAGCALLAAGLVAHRVATGRWELPAAGAGPVALLAALAGAAAVVTAAPRVARGWALVVPALLVALAAARAGDALVTVAVAGALGVAAARTRPPTAALAGLAVAAAALPATRPADRKSVV